MVRFIGSTFRVQGFHSLPWTAFGTRIYVKSGSFVRPIPNLRAKLAVIWQNENFITYELWTQIPEPLIWNSACPEQWKDWTSNIERPTSNVQYWWRYALSILKQANRSLRRALRLWAQSPNRLRVERLPSTCSGPEPVEGSRVEADPT